MDDKMDEQMVEAAEHLQQMIDRLERLEEERAALGQHVRDTLAEAKSAGFNSKVIRQILRIRKMDKHQVDEEEQLLHLYKQALGMA
ncbi:MAG: DUF2312 domain-containing protein [Magnetococcales bacterium]|nr:DUF2312 domain-containing protein [Magnetococcales bacterium]